MALVTGTFTGVRDLNIFYRLWLPAGGLASARAGIVLIHGAAEHSGRYDHLGNRYAQKKEIAVWALDLPGLGQSEGIRGHIDEFDDYLADVYLLVRMARGDLPGKQVFLLGFSLGGLIALDYGEKFGETIDGVAVSGPLLGLKVKVPPIKAAAATFLSAIAPKLALENELDASALARNQMVGREYLADPLLCTKVTTHWYTELIRAMEETNARSSLIRLPLLMMQGTADTIVDPEATRAFTAPHKEYAEFPGFYHELFNEDERGQAFAVLDKWLEKLL